MGEKHKFVVTKQMLDYAEDNSVIFLGETIDNAEHMNINNTGKHLLFVIVVGRVGDWAVYQAKYDDCNLHNTYFDTRRFIQERGSKVSRGFVEAIVEANEEVWNRYRK